jgi:hypothetical protein
MSGSSVISYSSGENIYSTTLNASDNTTGGGVWVEFKAVYQSEVEHYWLDVTRINNITSTTSPGVTDMSCIGALTVFPIADNIPSDYVICDGSLLLIDLYPELHSFLGYRFNSEPPEGYFQIPDYRGKFLRVWDNGFGIDPDADTRGDRGDGVDGDYPGTTQGDAIGTHDHSYAAGYGGTVPGAFSQGDSGSAGQLLITGPAGGAETRPINVNVVVCIRAKITNIDAIPEIELLMVKGQTNTTIGYLNENSEVGVAINANNYVDYMDNIGEGHQQTITTATDTPWGNFFPYRPSSNASKTVIRYNTNSHVDGEDAIYSINYLIHIDWYNRIYSCQIDAYCRTHNYPGKTIMVVNQPFGERVIDIVDYTTNEVAADGYSWWTSPNLTIEIMDIGVTKLPLLHLTTYDISDVIMMEITNYKVTIVAGEKRVVILDENNPAYTLPTLGTSFVEHLFIKKTTENVSIQCPPTAKIADSTLGGSIINNVSNEANWASLAIFPTVTEDTQTWLIVGGHGTWTTS